MRRKLAPRLGDARSRPCGAALRDHARSLRSGCLEILDEQLQLLNLVCTLFTALPKLHEPQFANKQSERFDLSGVRENLRVFDDDLLTMGKQFRVLRSEEHTSELQSLR